MKIKPLNKNVYVELIETENKTESGLYLARTKSDVDTGVIKATTSDLVQIGDKIIFNKHSGSKIDEKFLIIKDDLILGIIE